ncbi:TMV resistance protein N-like [Neltuma alba]|uniref:TMV resistance protein N-like n=1 Tax=Neltuma alba TaxID=207710 RepID=UPI0010A593AA|nr:TMV resistance protein N-like [Prosopis alba]
MASRELLSPSFSGEWTYDVFLSFRGEDTRTNFTGHLYNSLKQKGIQTFIDDVGLQRGEEITPALLEAIRQSRIAIIVFSKNYASSTFCLDELVNILHYVRGEGRLVWPVFYDVDPSDVRHQRGSYGQALAEHDDRLQANKEKVRKWREALCVAANLSGWHFQHGSQPEYEFISGIIEEVSKKINRVPLHIANHPVGLESSVQEVISLLELESHKGINMVGICGIGGVGKTTVALAVYNLIGDQFEGLCFLADIREKAIGMHGLVQLQETLLSEVIAENNLRIGNVHRGISIIKKRLRRKKVLLILDDIDKLKQLQVLAGGSDWFGSGSRIIVTTRDNHLLSTHGVEKLCEVKGLNFNESLELLSWNAFKSNRVDPDYMDVSNRAVSYAGGLPLALEVIGSDLFDRSTEEWNSQLDKYARIPHKDVHEILKVSYDSLEENEKEIFLDIACFFNKSELTYTKEMLYAHGLDGGIGITVLMDKSLIKIDNSNCVRMHDLIQDTGREIVRLESTSEPGKRSRLWRGEDIVHVLEENTGTEKIEVIMLHSCKYKEVQWRGVAFKKMKNLRILIIENVRFSRGPEYLPNTLRVLDWSGYPSSSLPSDFNPRNLLILSLPECCLQIFKPRKGFHSLCLMDFEGCKCLTQVHDLSGLPNLGALCLDNCTNLISIHESIGFHDKLRLLSAQGCTQLKMLATRINMTSLETVDLRGCSSFWKFPEVLRHMENIREIYLDHTAIKELPFSIGKLIGLKRLYLRRCPRLRQLPSSIFTIPKLEVVLSYRSRGFQLFGGDEIREKQRSEMSFPTIVLYSLPDSGNRGSRCPRFDHCPNGYCISKSEANFVQIFPLPETLVSFVPLSITSIGFPLFGALFNIFPMMENQKAISTAFYASRESSVSFWFRENFPKIAICVTGGSGTEIEDSILDIRLRVFVNGSEQLVYLCNYIVCKQKMAKHMIWCGLRCKPDRVISTHKWNHVQVSWELKYHRPYDPHRVISDDNGTPTTEIDLSGIHVYGEENSSIENIRFTNPDIPLSLVETMRNDRIIYFQDTSSHWDSKLLKPMKGIDLCSIFCRTISLSVT